MYSNIQYISWNEDKTFVKDANNASLTIELYVDLPFHMFAF